MPTNGHERSSSSIAVPPTTTLVGAKRRKCKIAHKINIEDKVNKIVFLFFFYEIFFNFSLHYSTMRDDQVIMKKKVYLYL